MDSQNILETRIEKIKSRCMFIKERLIDLEYSFKLDNIRIGLKLIKDKLQDIIENF